MTNRELISTALHDVDKGHTDLACETDNCDDSMDLYSETDRAVNNNDSELCIRIPVVPLRDIVIFPHAVSPLFVGRVKSVAAVMKAIAVDRRIFLVMQKNGASDNVQVDDLEKIGVVGLIVQYIKLPDETLKILVDADTRAKVLSYNELETHIEAVVDLVKIEPCNTSETQALLRTIMLKLREYVELSKRIGEEMLSNLAQICDPDVFADVVMSYLQVSGKVKQEILSVFNVLQRLEMVCALIMSEVDVLHAEREVQKRVKSQISKNHKEYYLNEQMKAIRCELGNGDDVLDSVERYQEMLQTKKLSKEGHDKAKEEIKRLLSSSSISAENIRAYLDWIFALPWNEYSDADVSISDAADILDRSHYGLDKVKDTILEYLAVQINNPDTTSPILCLYGPPGVGKTTLARAIAKAMGRKYTKIALGGVRDEAEIRGHRRTYVGALPGKIIQAMKKVGTCNPVILLDEIEKISNDYRGDPSSALLEALDPEQNKEFNDHYLEINYDLSKVMFIATANNLNMQRPLLDRLETIKISSYLEQDKVQICRHYIVKKQMETVGLKSDSLFINDEAISDIIKYYTRESGVRELERLIGKITRKSLMKLLKKHELSLPHSAELADNTELDIMPDADDSQKTSNAANELDVSSDDSQKTSNAANELDVSSDDSQKTSNAANELDIVDVCDVDSIGKDKKSVKPCIRITSRNLKKYLGIRRYVHSAAETVNLIGITNGLAYTEVGGDILLIEAVKIPGGKGEVKITGKLGDVMMESVQASVSYIRANCSRFGINASDIYSCDVHIHVPEGATPKDGPSAGVTICTTLVSLFASIPVRRDVAMTGEITLRGRVLAVGGLREKMVSALRSNIHTVIVPHENKKDIEEIPCYVKNQLNVIFCENIDDVLKIALVHPPMPLVMPMNAISDADGLEKMPAGMHGNQVCCYESVI